MRLGGLVHVCILKQLTHLPNPHSDLDDTRSVSQSVSKWRPDDALAPVLKKLIKLQNTYDNSCFKQHIWQTLAWLPGSISAGLQLIYQLACCQRSLAPFGHPRFSATGSSNPVWVFRPVAHFCLFEVAVFLGWRYLVSRGFRQGCAQLCLITATACPPASPRKVWRQL